MAAEAALSFSPPTDRAACCLAVEVVAAHLPRQAAEEQWRQHSSDLEEQTFP